MQARSPAAGRGRAHHRRARAARRGRAGADPARGRRDRAASSHASRALGRDRRRRLPAARLRATRRTRSGSPRALAAAGLDVSASARVLREYREYERWSTTVVNAYVTPVMRRLSRRARDPPRRRSLRRSCSRTAAGSPAAAAKARRRAHRSSPDRPPARSARTRSPSAAGHPRVIGFDMGGTSTDVCLIDGAIPTTADTMVGDFPVRLPVIDIHSVGAGGGSIAHLDSGGALRVGPRSAGAAPGPGLLRRRHRADRDRRQPAARPPRSGAVPRRSHDARRRARRSRRGRPGRARRPRRAGPRRRRRPHRQRQHGARDPRRLGRSAASIRAIFALLAFGGAGGMHACAIAADARHRAP